MRTKASKKADKNSSASTTVPAKAARRVSTTLGELIAAACETAGSAREVARLLRSDEMTRRLGRRLVFV